MSKLTSRSAALVAVSVFSLAACSSGDDSASDAPSTSGTSVGTTEPITSATDPADSPSDATSVPETTAPPESAPPESTTAPPEPTPAPEPEPEADNGECLVGSWVVTEDQMNTFYSGLMSTLDAPLLVTATGSAALTFNADGTYGWAPAFDLFVEVAGTSGTGATTGSITGGWTAADGIVTTMSEVNSLEVTVTVGGSTVSGSDMANGMLNRSPVNGVTYSCAGPTPVLDFHTADPAVTVPVALAPA